LSPDGKGLGTYMTKWWRKYRDEPKVLKSIVEKMVDIDREICDSFEKKEREVLIKHGHGSIGGLSKTWRDKFWELQEDRKRLIHPLWVDISEIWETLTP